MLSQYTFFTHVRPGRGPVCAAVGLEITKQRGVPTVHIYSPGSFPSTLGKLLALSPFQLNFSRLPALSSQEPTARHAGYLLLPLCHPPSQLEEPRRPHESFNPIKSFWEASPRPGAKVVQWGTDVKLTVLFELEHTLIPRRTSVRAFNTGTRFACKLRYSE